MEQKLNDAERYNRRWNLRLYGVPERSEEDFKAVVTARDLVWRSAKANEYLHRKHLRFKEDLTAADKETRTKLWPIVEKARKEEKRAYFVGNKDYIDKKEARVT